MPDTLYDYDQLIEAFKQGTLDRGQMVKGSTITFGDVCDLVGRHPHSIRATIWFSGGEPISVRGAYVSTANIKILHDFFSTLQEFDSFEEISLENGKLVAKVHFD